MKMNNNPSKANFKQPFNPYRIQHTLLKNIEYSASRAWKLAKPLWTKNITARLHAI